MTRLWFDGPKGPACADVVRRCLRLAGVSLVGAALSDWDVQRSLMFILGLMLWSEGVLPPNGECRRSGREVCDKISS